MNIKPLKDQVLVKRSKAPTTKNGIFLPESAQEKPKQGEIVATGPGKYDEKGVLITMNVKVGDHILFGSYAGTEVKTDETDVEYLIMSEEEVLAVLVTK